MHHTLCELFNGNISPYEADKIENPEYDKALKEICSLEQDLSKMLKGRPLRQLEKLISLQGKLDVMETEGSFVYGFRLGARVMLEVIGTYSTEEL